MGVQVPLLARVDGWRVFPCPSVAVAGHRGSKGARRGERDARRAWP